MGTGKRNNGMCIDGKHIEMMMKNICEVGECDHRIVLRTDGIFKLSKCPKIHPEVYDELPPVSEEGQMISDIIINHPDMAFEMSSHIGSIMRGEHPVLTEEFITKFREMMKSKD